MPGKKFEIIILTLFLLLKFSARMYAGDIEDAKTFFNNYVSLCHKYDKSALDLYSDNAVIKRVLIYPNGKTRTVILSTKKLKIN